MIKPFKRRPGISDEVADYCEQLDKLPELQGQVVNIAFPSGGATFVVVKHGLGRCYRGAQVWHQSDDSKSLQIKSPKTIAAQGYDPTKVLIVGCTTSTTMTATIWVF